MDWQSHVQLPLNIPSGCSAAVTRDWVPNYNQVFAQLQLHEHIGLVYLFFIYLFYFIYFIYLFFHFSFFGFGFIIWFSISSTGNLFIYKTEYNTVHQLNLNPEIKYVVLNFWWTDSNECNCGHVTFIYASMWIFFPLCRIFSNVSCIYHKLKTVNFLIISRYFHLWYSI